MNSIQLECFISAAETLNFTKTAKLLYISQPTVTHHISTLESELGYLLFERVNKQVFLTPAGKSFYKSMKAVSSEFHNAMIRAKKYGDGYKQELVIGCGSSVFEEQFLPELIQQFKQTHEDIYISFHVDPIREKMVLLQQEKIDILFSTTEVNPDRKRFAHIPLQTYGMVCVMNHQNKLAHLKKIRMEDIGNQNLILMDRNYATPEIEELQKVLEKKYEANVIQYLSDVRLTHLIILCDMGIAIMPEFKYHENEKLIALPFEWDKKVSYGITMKKGEERIFVKEFAELAKNLWNIKSGE